MKVSVLLGSAAALLLAGVPTAQAAPMGLIEARDFSAKAGHWYQLQQLMHNIHSRIGVPFSAMRNVGLGYHQILEIDPLDLVLLPNGYCYSCATAPHNDVDRSKRPNPFQNQLVELDETNLLVACTDPDHAQTSEWPLMKACPGQEHVLKDFLIDLTGDGSRLAVPKARLEGAAMFLGNKHISSSSLLPASVLRIPASSTSATPPATKLNVPDFAASIYGHKRPSNTVESPAMTSFALGRSAAEEAVPTLITSSPTSAVPKTTSVSSSTISSSAKPTELPTSTLGKEDISATQNSTTPTST